MLKLFNTKVFFRTVNPELKHYNNTEVRVLSEIAGNGSNTDNSGVMYIVQFIDGTSHSVCENEIVVDILENPHRYVNEFSLCEFAALPCTMSDNKSVRLAIGKDMYTHKYFLTYKYAKENEITFTKYTSQSNTLKDLFYQSLNEIREREGVK